MFSRIFEQHLSHDVARLRYFRMKNLSIVKSPPTSSPGVSRVSGVFPDNFEEISPSDFVDHCDFASKDDRTELGRGFLFALHGFLLAKLLTGAPHSPAIHRQKITDPSRG